ncbi:methyl-accepting chemotaxis protein [Methanococcus voltae PS]|uniref:Methyl-accepting chemotaxis protein n=1 Tax=Methanococcus voltae PS TaxID=523842 RepID=A0ABT2EXN6_METVO|nr:methyl-accepting chemotaxis protein [Methanococcus voltae]MCS3922726.1 methyl-accepting chemotaxis protein [Methanococcus voltae PS]
MKKINSIVKKLSHKMLIMSMISILIPMVILSTFSINGLDNLASKSLDKSAELSLNSGSLSLDDKMKSYDKFSEYTSSTKGLKKEIMTQNISSLKSRIKFTNSMQDVELMAITDENGTIMASTAHDNDFKINNIISKFSKSPKTTAFEAVPGNIAEKISNYKVRNTNDALAIVSVAPIYYNMEALSTTDKNGKIIGYFVIMDVLNNDATYLSELQEETGSSATLTLYDSRVSTTADNKDLIGKKINSEAYNSLKTQDRYYENLVIDGNYYYCGYKALRDIDGNLVGTLGIGAHTEEILSVLDETRSQIITVIAITLLLALIMSLYAGRLITKPLNTLKDVAEKFGAGNFSARANIKTGDELEDLSNSFNLMAENIQSMGKLMEADKEKLAETIMDVSKVMKKLSEGDFTVHADESKDINGLQKSINLAIENIGELIKDLRKDIEVLDSEIESIESQLTNAEESAEQLTDAASQVANAASDQSVKLQNSTNQLMETFEGTKLVNDTIENMVKIAGSIKGNSNEGTHKVENATGTMNNIANVIDNLSKSIGELGTESKKINEVTTLIKDVADQTGLLALNASIEAARAGEAGKGFAVVASEIKDLAEEIKKSVEDINKTIKGINCKIDETIELGNTGKSQVKKGVLAIAEVNSAFEGIQNGVANSGSRMDNIYKGSQNAATNVNLALKNSQEVAAIAEEFAATAEEVTASTEELNSIIEEIRNASKELTKISGNVSKKTNEFKA